MAYIVVMVRCTCTVHILEEFQYGVLRYAGDSAGRVDGGPLDQRGQDLYLFRDYQAIHLVYFQPCKKYKKILVQSQG
jgi:hypothetical protein